MTISEFADKYQEFMGDETSARDVLKRVAANLSDLQYEVTMSESPEKHTVEKCNLLKEYIFDYLDAMRNQAYNLNIK